MKVSRFLIRSRILLFLKGMAMGAADSVPGVSGGTIAFITNIYEELIYSIQSCNLLALRTLFTAGPKAAWRHINGGFLLTLLAGIVTGLFLLLNTVLFLLENYQAYVMSFFIGLIVASSWHIGKQIHEWHARQLMLLCGGAVLSVALTLLPEVNQEINLIYIFFCAALAICAMILPGISGAFILVLLGSYEAALNAVRTVDVAFIAVFLAGCVFGLISFANLLSWLFRHRHQQTLIVLLGILAGSIYAIWPWQPDYGTAAPALFEPAFFGCIISGIVGFALVYSLEQLNRTKTEPTGGA